MQSGGGGGGRGGNPGGKGAGEERAGSGKNWNPFATLLHDST